MPSCAFSHTCTRKGCRWTCRRLVWDRRAARPNGRRADDYPSGRLPSEVRSAAASPVPAAPPPAQPNASPRAIAIAVNPQNGGDPCGGPATDGRLRRSVLMADTQTANLQAHEAYLRFATALQGHFAQTVAWQTTIFREGTAVVRRSAELSSMRRERLASPPPADGVPRSLSFEQCVEFARGLVGNVLGPRFAADRRLPDPRPPAGRAAPARGSHRHHRGRAALAHLRPGGHRAPRPRRPLVPGARPHPGVCRRSRPGRRTSSCPGSSGSTSRPAGWRAIACSTPPSRSTASCRRSATDPLRHPHRPVLPPGRHVPVPLPVRGDGERRAAPDHARRLRRLLHGRGTGGRQGDRSTALDLKPMPGNKPADWAPSVPLRDESLIRPPGRRPADAATWRPRSGRRSRGPTCANPMRLPGGMLQLVHRVERIDPAGGRYGLGLIRCEADIHPDDWFLTCHFVDDQVMPGTLMYECCLHTMRVLLMRMGWVGEDGEARFEPVPGVAEPAEVPRAGDRGDEKGDLRGVAQGDRVPAGAVRDRRRPDVRRRQADRGGQGHVAATERHDGSAGRELAAGRSAWRGTEPEPIPRSVFTARAGPRVRHRQARPRRSATAIGRSTATAFIARLPGPPFSFLDRVMRVENGEPWKLDARRERRGRNTTCRRTPGTSRPTAADRCRTASCNEIALQACGWTAAYLGSALTSPDDLHFRNLGGNATQHAASARTRGRSTTDVQLTRVSPAAGMIILAVRLRRPQPGAGRSTPATRRSASSRRRRWRIRSGSRTHGFCRGRPDDRVGPARCRPTRPSPTRCCAWWTRSPGA